MHNLGRFRHKKQKINGKKRTGHKTKRKESFMDNVSNEIHGFTNLWTTRKWTKPIKNLLDNNAYNLIDTLDEQTKQEKKAHTANCKYIVEILFICGFQNVKINIDEIFNFLLFYHSLSYPSINVATCKRICLQQSKGATAAAYIHLTENKTPNKYK